MIHGYQLEMKRFIQLISLNISELVIKMIRLDKQYSKMSIFQLIQSLVTYRST